jgi:hypothetical protein
VITVSEADRTTFKRLLGGLVTALPTCVRSERVGAVRMRHTLRHRRVANTDVPVLDGFALDQR